MRTNLGTPALRTATALTCIATALGIVGCSEVTEIAVVVDTDLGISCRIDHLTVLATSNRGAGTPAVEVPLGFPEALPGFVTYVPGSGVDLLTVRVQGKKDGVVVAEAVANDIKFESGKSLRLPITLTESCVGVACDQTPSGALQKFSGEVGTGIPKFDCSCNAHLGRDVLNCGACGRMCVAGQRCSEGMCVNRTDRYRAAEGSQLFQSACDIPDHIQGTLANRNDVEEPAPPGFNMPIPFPFRFYGIDVERLWLGTNGYIGFGSQAPMVSRALPQQLDQQGSPRLSALPFWEVLETRTRGICLAVAGTEPNRQLHITWADVCFFRMGFPCDAPDGLGRRSQDNLNFSVILEESTNRILLHYGNMVSDEGTRGKGSGAVIGVTSDIIPNCRSEECFDPALDDANSNDGVCKRGANKGQLCGFTQYSGIRGVESIGSINGFFVELTPEN